MALASGAKTFKMKFGHHGANHPVKDLDSGRVSITSQNHGFAVDEKTLPANLRATHVSLFDGTLQGLARTDKPAFCFQGHPEASPGPARHRLPVRPLHGPDGPSRREEVRMPKRTDIKSILIIGAGPIIIGQACEFDYSGVQACKALREEGYKVILINSNPATIMTDPATADVTYIEPITWQTVEKIIAKEKPDAILPTMGGQTALNCALDLWHNGVLRQVQGRADRRHARSHRQGRGPPEVQGGDDQDRPGLGALGHRPLDGRGLGGAEDAWAFPTVIRPSFTLGGTGGGIAYNPEEFEVICKRGLEASPTSELLIEESLLGWKEFEMEVVRDKADNCIIICSIENLDPMGVHTGDSITVAPAQTLTDKEYQIMRNASIAVLREIGVDTGGSNVQFSINPKDGRMIVIEMNPRVSRSSALASKATGFPIAKVAAKLAVGYTLDELRNEITGGATPASFEPSIDYVVTKIPRFAFEKFPQADSRLTTQMKSVGEVMAMGRTFQESFQKALRGLEVGVDGLNEKTQDREVLEKELGEPGPERIWYVGDAFAQGMSVDEVYELTKIDKWFLVQIEEIVKIELELEKMTLDQIDEPTLRMLKKKGFSDRRLARQLKTTDKVDPRQAPRAGRAPGLQARGHLRRRVRDQHRLHVLDLRGRVRGRADQQQEDHGAGRRAQPHRPGHRVRLLLRACRARDARGRLRDHHGQLQSGDRVDRLRHLRPPVLRAADAGRRAGDRRQGKAAGRDRAVRRPDAAEAGAGPGGRGRADHRHLARHDRRGRRPRALPEAAARAQAAASRRTPRRAPRPKRWRKPRRWAIRWWCVPATCWAAARWRSCTSSATWSATCARR